MPDLDGQHGRYQMRRQYQQAAVVWGNPTAACKFSNGRLTTEELFAALTPETPI
jgi:hypothetical protein